MTPRSAQPRVDELVSAWDPDDDEVVREAAARAKSASPPGQTHLQPLEPEAPAPRGPDEVVCRSCHLVLRRPHLNGIALAVCEDCRR